MKKSGFLEIIVDSFSSASDEVDSWEIINLIRTNRSLGGDKAIIAAVKKLSLRKDKKIFKIDDTIRKFVYDLDGRVWASQVYDDLDTMSPEEFLHIRCGAVVRGERYYNKLLKIKAKLDKNYKFEYLLDVPALAWAKKHGEDPDKYPHVSQFSCETYSNESGWEERAFLSNEDETDFHKDDKQKMKLFVEKAVQNEKIWFVYDDRGYPPAIRNIDGTAARIIPMFPEEDLALDFISIHPNESWVVRPKNLYQFLDEELQEYEEYPSSPGLYWNSGDYLDITFKTIGKAIRKELLRGPSGGVVDKDEIINRIAEGRISETGVEYIFDRLIKEGFPFDDRELQAYFDGIKLKTISSFRKNGWPKYCGRCFELINYDKNISIVSKAVIICNKCTATLESEEGTEQLPFNEDVLSDIAQYGFNTKEMIEKVRKNYSAFGDYEKDRLIFPDWLIDNEEDSLLEELYEDSKILITGKPVYGCLYKFHKDLLKEYVIGEPIALPADIVYSLDPYYDENPFELAVIVNKISSYKDSHLFPAELEDISEYLSGENHIVFNLMLPGTITGGREVYITTSMIQKNHIPLMRVEGRFFPLLVNPEESITTTIVPNKYWPIEMVYFSSFTDDEYIEKNI